MKDRTDILVIGGGPAGLTAASYAARAGYDTLLIDAAAPGGQLMYIAEVENFPGFSSIGGMELAEKLEAQAVSFGVEIEYTEALKIAKNDEKDFLVTTADGDIKTKSVILALGAQHRKLGAKGESEYEGRGVSYCATCDGPFFKGKTVTVVGGGDTALTDALYLSKLASKVYLVHRRDEFRAQKAIADKVRKNEKIELCLKENVVEIRGDGQKVTDLVFQSGKVIKSDGIFILVGILPANSLVKDLVELDDQGFILSNAAMETSVKGIFVAGDVRNTPFRQIVTACGDGASAAHSADEYISK